MVTPLLARQPVPMLDNPFSEEIFPNTQCKPPLAQLEAIWGNKEQENFG